VTDSPTGSDTDHGQENTQRGRIRDTYHAALQHDHVNPKDEDLVLGVVAKPMYGIQNHIDENRPALAPAPDALAEFKQRADEIGHNEAIEELDFETRYRQRIKSSDTAETEIERIVSILEDGRNVWLVCYENTDRKWCHRCALKDMIESRLQTSTKDARTDGGRQ